MAFTLPKLPYSYSALEPWFDARTMEIHHTKHHQAYIDKLNAALEKFPEYQDKPIEDLLTSLDEIPETIRREVRNHGGGHYNHSLFWKVLAHSGAEARPVGGVADAIQAQFGSFENFKDRFTKEAVSHFGSGWAWLLLDPSGKLVVKSSHDQDCPLSEGFYPLYVLDLWEHAYYLQYQNLRPAFVNASWNCVNWKEVERRFSTREGLISSAA